jgi:hypothetical protein
VKCMMGGSPRICLALGGLLLYFSLVTNAAKGVYLIISLYVVENTYIFLVK